MSAKSGGGSYTPAVQVKELDRAFVIRDVVSAEGGRAGDAAAV